MKLFSRVHKVDTFLLSFRHTLRGVVDASKVSVETSIANWASCTTLQSTLMSVVDKSLSTDIGPESLTFNFASRHLMQALAT